jgi:VRR-NUC domain-containing protein
MTEEEFLRQVIRLAKLRGFAVHHGRPGRTNKGWRTPIQGDAGFPDCVLIRGNVIIFAELKTDCGRLRRNQETWLHLLRQAGQRAYCWRPSDWSAIEEILK